jgi:multisubunit Na+/H+ antiporter MnhB subunit
MKWASVLGIAAVLGLMTLYEWPKMKGNMKKEKITFAAVTLAGGILAVWLVFYPGTPGPTQLFDFLYKPLVHYIENLTAERGG